MGIVRNRKMMNSLTNPPAAALSAAASVIGQTSVKGFQSIGGRILQAAVRSASGGFGIVDPLDDQTVGHAHHAASVMCHARVVRHQHDGDRRLPRDPETFSGFLCWSWCRDFRLVRPRRGSGDD